MSKGMTIVTKKIVEGNQEYSQKNKSLPLSYSLYLFCLTTPNEPRVGTFNYRTKTLEFKIQINVLLIDSERDNI